LHEDLCYSLSYLSSLGAFDDVVLEGFVFGNSGSILGDFALIEEEILESVEGIAILGEEDLGLVIMLFADHEEYI